MGNIKQYTIYSSLIGGGLVIKIQRYKGHMKMYSTYEHEQNNIRNVMQLITITLLQ